MQHAWGDKTAHKILVRKYEGKRPLEDISVDVKWIFKKQGVECIHVAQNRVQWQALVNMIIENFLTS
jgi:hypothetical protein